MMTLLLKGRHKMMTLRLRRCVSLFVCLSLLLSACSPDKSSKAGNKVSSKASEFSRNTEVEKDSVEKIADHAPSAVNKNNVTPVGFRNRELGKVLGFSVTPKRLAVGTTVAVLATVAIIGGRIWWLRHKKEEGKPKTPIEQEKYEEYKIIDENLKAGNLSVEQIDNIANILSQENISLQKNKELKNQMKQMASLLNLRVKEHLHEMSPQVWNDIKNCLKADVANEMDKEWQKNLIFITVPAPQKSKILSVEERNALKEANTIQDENNILEDKDEDDIEHDVRNWSYDTMKMFNETVFRIKEENKKQNITYAIAKTITESTLTEKNLNKVLSLYNDERTKRKVAEKEEKTATTAEEAKKTLPQNLQDTLKKYISAKTTATRLATLRNLGNEWDNEDVRQDLKDRMLDTNEILALNTIMETIKERALNSIMIKTMFGIKKILTPEDMVFDVFR
jgi:hypothetical protein